MAEDYTSYAAAAFHNKVLREREKWEEEWEEERKVDYERMYVQHFIKQPDIKPLWEAYVAELKLSGRWLE